jgi:predicted esterase
MGQGASTALNYSYTAEPIPAGAIALSGSLLPQTQLKNLHKMPSLLMHGLKDDTIKEIAARKSYK